MSKYLQRMSGNMIHKNIILTHIPYNKSIKVLDYGGGTGVVSERVKNTFPLAEVHYFDIDFDMCEIAERYYSAHFYYNYERDIMPQKFDVIILSSVLHEIEKPALKLLSIIHNFLKEGGKIIIRDGLRPSLGVKSETIIQIKTHEVERMREYIQAIPSDSYLYDKVWIHDDNYLCANDYLMQSFLQTYTWGFESLQRETQQDQLIFSIKQLQHIFANLSMEINTLIPIRQDDYFNYLKDIVYLPPDPWDTHFFAVATKGETSEDL